MRLPRTLLIVALLGSAVSGCSRTPAPATSSHPPAEDLRCQAEPAALTDQQAADATRLPDGRSAGEAANDKFNDDALIAGRSCRDALRRSCQWHKDRGDKTLDCSALPPPGAVSLNSAQRRAVAAFVERYGPFVPAVAGTR